jgi:hypothetical protein
MNPEKADTGHAWLALNFPSAPHAPNSGNLRSLRCSRAPERPLGHPVGAIGAAGFC